MQFANAIWVQENEEKLSVEEDFLKQNVFFYDADIYKAVFDEDTLKSLNLWVEEKTGGRPSPRKSAVFQSKASSMPIEGNIRFNSASYTASNLGTLVLTIASVLAPDNKSKKCSPSIVSRYSSGGCK